MIKAAAIKDESGKIWSLPVPARHNHILEHMRLCGVVYKVPSGLLVAKGEQGFIDDQGIFLNRIEAGKHAIACSQISYLRWPPNLYSEDLW